MMKETNGGMKIFAPWRTALFLVTAGLVISYPLAHRCFAQETAAPGPEQAAAASLEALRAADKAVLDSFSALQKQVEVEQQKGEESARDLKSIAHSISFLSRTLSWRGFDSMTFFSHHWDPGELVKYPEVKKAEVEFHSARKQHTAIYKKHLPLAYESLIAATAKVCREQGSPQQIAEVLKNLSAYEELPKSLDSDASGYQSFEFLLRYLRGFRTFATALSLGDMSALGGANAALEESLRYEAASFQLAELEQHRKRAIARIREPAAAELDEIIKLLPTVVTVEEMNPWIAKMEARAATEEALTGRREGIWDQRYHNAAYFLSKWRVLLSLEADGRWTESAEYARNLPNTSVIDDPRLVTLVKDRAELAAVKGRKEREAKITDFSGKLPQRLSSITTPDALQEITDEIAALLRNNEQMDDPRFQWLQVFQRELQQITSVWRVIKADPVFAARAILESSAPAHPWSKEVTKLREKVARQALASSSEYPELLAPPLDGLPLADAFQQLITSAVSGSKWERVHELLEKRAALMPKAANPQEITAVKAYLVGINLEKAELYPDAVQSYQTVLSHVSRNVPSKEAGERIKAIKATHPNLFQPVSQ